MKTDLAFDSDITVVSEEPNSNSSDRTADLNRHIIRGGSFLCDDLNGNHSGSPFKVEKSHSVKTPYPLRYPNLCKTCARSYIKQYGSNDELFNNIPTFNKGQKVIVITEKRERFIGRVRSTSSKFDFPERTLTLVFSDEPQQRWPYGIEDCQQITVTEGEKPTFEDRTFDGSKEVRIDKIKQSEFPTSTIDRKTDETIADIESILNISGATVTVFSEDIYTFAIYVDIVDEQFWNNISKLHRTGYIVQNIEECEDKEKGTIRVIVESNNLLD